jgi:hypothetical protein
VNRDFIARPAALAVHRVTTAVLFCALALAALLAAAAPAGAAVGHSVLRTFSTGPNTDPRAIAADAAGNVYVLEAGAARVDKFDAAGNRANFSATAGYVGEASITGTTEAPFDIAGWADQGLSLDRSGGANDGHIYVTRTDNNGTASNFAYDSTGRFLGRLGANGEAYCANAVNQATGEFYEARAGFQGIYRYAPPSGNLAVLTPNGSILASAVGFDTCPLAVDDAGAVYTGSSPVRKFAASQFNAASPAASAELNVPARALAVDPGNGNVYADSGTQIVVFNPAGAQQGSAFGSLAGSRGVTGDGNGNILATDSGGGVFVYGPAEVNLPKASTGNAANVTASGAKVEGTVDPDGAGNVTGCVVRYGEDSGYSAGSAPCSPAAPITTATPITANLTGLLAGTTYRYRVFATNANGTQMASSDQTFTTAAAVAGVSTEAATGVDKDSAVLHGSFTGNGSEAHYFFEWGATTAYGHTTPAPPGDSAGSGSGTQNVAPVSIAGLHGATRYHYRLVVSNATGISRGGDESFLTPDAVTNLTADPPTAVTDTSASLNASFDGDSTYETHYYFEWGATLEYGNKVPLPPGTAVAAGSGRIHVPAVPISGLKKGLTYHYRVVASNAIGTTVSADASFKTAEAPLVGNLNSRNLQPTTAELVGEVNPRFGNTTYTFQWGKTATYGNESPAPPASAGSGDSLVFVGTEITGLTPGVTYHFRLVASNQYGSTATPDQTFGFYPANCPNAQVRQETRSNTLPDCRAYELVTPSFAQGSIIFPMGGPQAPLATKPSRLAYSAAFGTFPETAGNPQNILGDLFVSTRSDTGWYQKYVGRPANETWEVGGPPKDLIEFWFQSQWGPSRISMGVQASPDLSRLASYDLGWPDFYEQRGTPSNAPYVWRTSDASLLGRFPTNLTEVEHGEEYVGIPETSPDFNHFIFQSNLVFDDAKEGNFHQRQIICCQANLGGQVPAASIYDNDLKTGSVVLASIKGNDETGFEGYVYNISDDGSRILMAEERSELPNEYTPPNTHVARDVQGPFYLRVNQQHTFEIGAGHKLAWIGSASDGRTIYFRSPDQLSPQDTDSSSDIYLWKESDPSNFTLVSLGDHGDAGNSDECDNITWNGGGCNVESLDFTLYSGVRSKIQGLNGGQGGNGNSDSSVSSTSGDIYFISPEVLLEGKGGQPGQANLYGFRKGSLRFVATLKPGEACTVLPLIAGCATGPVMRMQITPDGSHMAFVTQSKITGYDNAGKAEMYVYNPENGQVTCASCRPDGQPPTSETLASQNGLFQTYDGRAFFSTSDALVPRDTNESEDIYEYTEGRAQLISSGIGIQFKGYNGYQGLQTAIGLVSVSANGTDVYFATTDSLVTQDHNGAAIKIYDARTGGGFPAELTPPNCTAADECHGPGVTPPPLPPDRTSAVLGAGSKASSHKTKKHKAKKHKKKATKQKKGKAKKQGRTHRG